MKKKILLLKFNCYLVVINIYFIKLISGVIIDFMLLI